MSKNEPIIGSPCISLISCYQMPFPCMSTKSINCEEIRHSLWYITMNLHERFNFNAFCRGVIFHISTVHHIRCEIFALTYLIGRRRTVRDDDDDKWQVLCPTVQYSSQYICTTLCSLNEVWNFFHSQSLWCENAKEFLSRAKKIHAIFMFQLTWENYRLIHLTFSPSSWKFEMRGKNPFD